uniref:Uncharacterized protein n=1 Tax=uncultured marine virus TaxID=186617 RepID=A0A0F7L291_9VIRU|nr:hypothetical protein [uncultured marine virus]
MYRPVRPTHRRRFFVSRGRLNKSTELRLFSFTQSPRPRPFLASTRRNRARSSRGPAPSRDREGASSTSDRIGAAR